MDEGIRGKINYTLQHRRYLKHMKTNNELKHVEEKILHFGDIELNITFPCVKIKDVNQYITKYQYKLLKVFLQYPNKILTYSMINDLVYSEQYIAEHSVRDLLCRVRKIIKNSNCEIIFYSNLGYKLKIK